MEQKREFARSSEKMNYEQVNDESLVRVAQSGDGRGLEVLLGKYKDLAKAKAKAFFLSGADREDLIQEGMIGLFKAIRDFAPEKAVSFRTFAELCIDRQLVTAVRTATRKKHIPLNFYVSLDKPVSVEGEEKKLLVDTLSDMEVSNPLSILIGEEELERTWACFRNTLTEQEIRVIDLRMVGESYREIADKLGISYKSVDNTLQRAKHKINKCRQSTS
ncbi:MAG: RNA polymerase sporulation sigma factor SigH [Actinomycetota bacterium]